MKRILLLSFCFGILLVSCNKKDITIPDPQLETIFGTWELVVMSGGFAGQTETPETMGYTTSLVLLRNGKANWYKNGDVYKKEKFELVNSPSGSVYPYQINFTESFDSWISLNNDSLMLSPSNTNDVPSWLFVREK